MSRVSVGTNTETAVRLSIELANGYEDGKMTRMTVYPSLHEVEGKAKERGEAHINAVLN